MGWGSFTQSEGDIINTKDCPYIAAKYSSKNTQYESWIGCECNNGPDGVQANNGDIYAGHTCKNKKWTNCIKDSDCELNQVCNIDLNICMMEEEECYDSDYGIQSTKKGNTSLKSFANTFTDYCAANNESAEKVNIAANYLVEYYCKDKEIENTILKCPINQKCFDGACISICKNDLECKESEYCDKPPGICKEKCVDTDNDDGNNLNYMVKGIITGGKFLQGDEFVKDHCIDKNGNNVNISDLIREYACTLDKTKHIQFSPHTCQCFFGKCLPETENIEQDKQLPNNLVIEQKENELNNLCIDSDNSNENNNNMKYNITGYVINENGQKYNDQCSADGKELTEQLCNSKFYKFKTIICTNEILDTVCENGACIKKELGELKELQKNTLQDNISISSPISNTTAISPATISALESSLNNEPKSKKIKCIPKYNNQVCNYKLNKQPCINFEKKYLCPSVNNCDEKKLIVELCNIFTNSEFINHCFNNKKDSDEIEVDCGGNDCKKCFDSVNAESIRNNLSYIPKENTFIEPKLTKIITSENNKIIIKKDKTSFIKYLYYIIFVIILVLLLMLLFYVIFHKKLKIN